MVFEGHKLAVWDPQSIHNALEAIPPSITNRWTLGDSVSIEPAVIRTLEQAPGRNAMIVTSHDDLVASLVASWIKSNNPSAPLVREPVAPDTTCLLYTSPSPRDRQKSRMPSSA